MGWVLFGLTLLAAVAAVVMLQRKNADEVARLEEEGRAALADAQSESERRVDRLEREANRARDTQRDALVKDLLPALDSVRMAHESMSDPEVLKGLELVLSEFHRGLARHGIEVIEPAESDAFDPHEHEAVESVPGEGDVGGKVARCHRAGYRSGDKVLRPAMVGVFVSANAGPESASSDVPHEDVGEVILGTEDSEEVALAVDEDAVESPAKA